MSQQERKGRLQITDRLENLIASHEERQSNFTSQSVRVGEILHQMFDHYVGKEIDEIVEEISLLRDLGDDLNEENTQLLILKKDFEATKTKLIEHLKKLKAAQELPDWVLFAQAGMIVDSVERLRDKVERWAHREVRDADMVLQILDEELGRRVINDPRFSVRYGRG